METKKISIGLFGFGCVGQGLYDVLNHSESLTANIRRICVKNHTKERKIDASNFTFDKADILERDDLDVVVELIDNAEDAFSIVKAAMKNGVNVVSANKKMIAENFEELFELQNKHNVSFLYEGCAGGSIPIIRNLEEYYDNELLSSISGILNGSCNYILTKMELNNLSYEEVLKQAQEKGFAEADPWLDVAGFDTKYKICILSIHAFGLVLAPEQILNLGIQNITYDDILYAKEKNMRIKLIAQARKVGNKFQIFVLPRFVNRYSDLFNILYEYNGVEVEGAYSDKQTFVGKGAGSYPTGSAVLSDVSALTYNYKYGYRKLRKIKEQANGNYQPSTLLDNDFSLKLYIRFRDRKSLDDIEILSIEEEYRSRNTNYIIANVSFASLFNIYNRRDNELFVCIAE